MVALVIGTVLIYGSLMPLVAKCLLGQREAKHPGIKQPTMKKFSLQENVDDKNNEPND